MMILDEEYQKRIDETRKLYEFLTFLILNDDVIVGIIQNETPKIYMLYQLDEIRDVELREQFLQYGDEWWWGSNQSVPINSFIGRRFDVFESCLKGYSKKSVQQIIGPTFNLAEKYLKRVKKKRVDILQVDQNAGKRR